MDLPEKSTNFEKTLIKWGVKSGPYIILPFMGPTTFRGAISTATEFFADPMVLAMQTKKLIGLSKGKRNSVLIFIVGSETTRSRAELIETLEELQKNSLDFYVTVRNLAQQKTKSDEEAINEEDEDDTEN